MYEEREERMQADNTCSGSASDHVTPVRTRHKVARSIFITFILDRYQCEHEERRCVLDARLEARLCHSPSWFGNTVTSTSHGNSVDVEEECVKALQSCSKVQLRQHEARSPFLGQKTQQDSLSPSRIAKKPPHPTRLS